MSSLLSLYSNIYHDNTFFSSYNECGNKYLLSHVVHDWQFEKSIRLLINIERTCLLISTGWRSLLAGYFFLSMIVITSFYLLLPWRYQILHMEYPFSKDCLFRIFTDYLTNSFNLVCLSDGTLGQIHKTIFVTKLTYLTILSKYYW